MAPRSRSGSGAVRGGARCSRPETPTAISRCSKLTHHQDKPVLRLLVLHDDPEREFHYTSGAEQAFTRAGAEGWTVVEHERERGLEPGCLSVRRRRTLLAAPDGRALLQERGHALLGVGGERVVGHDDLAVLVGRGARSGRSGRRTPACRWRPCKRWTRDRQRPARRPPRRARRPGTTRLTSPQSSAVSASIGSPVSSISIARLRPTARDTGHHRRRAEQPDLDAGGGEARALGGDRQVAGGHQLAAGGGGDAVHLGDHRLRQLVDRLHHHACRRRTARGRTRRRGRSSRTGRARPRTPARRPRSRSPGWQARADASRSAAISSSISSSDSALRLSGRLSVIRAGGSVLASGAGLGTGRRQ